MPIDLSKLANPILYIVILVWMCYRTYHFVRGFSVSNVGAAKGLYYLGFGWICIIGLGIRYFA